MATNNVQKRLEASNARIQRCVNKWSAKIIPALLIGAVGYSVWVIVVLLALNHLIRPPRHVRPETGAGVAIIVIYFLLFLLTATSYFRVLYVIHTNPGFVPSPQFRRIDRGLRSGRCGVGSSSVTEKDAAPSDEATTTPSQQVGHLNRGSVSSGRTGPPAGLESFYKRDIFECEVDGLPRWCSTCKAWKPDRTHHSGEVGRCIYKMDHFCPWAGGIISETSFKFFVQFCLYGAAFNGFVLVVSAYYTAEMHLKSNTYNVNWIVAIALSGIFLFFSSGITFNNFHAVFTNSTTVDNLTRRTRIHHFAVLIAQPTYLASFSNLPHTYPIPPPQQQQQQPPQEHSSALPTNPTPPLPSRTSPFTTIIYPLYSSAPPNHPHETRTFAILATQTGSNPYLLPSIMENFKSVMGERWWDWVLPLRYSPCYDNGHDDEDGIENDHGMRGSMYSFGHEMEAMIKGAGLVVPGENVVKVGSGKTRRRRPRRRERAAITEAGDRPERS